MAVNEPEPGGAPARAVFLDKDGTVLEDVPYNVDPSLMRLAPGVDEGLRLLHQARFALIVVSNQSGIARGYFEEGALGPVEARLRELFARGGVPLDGFAFCPHHPEGSVDRYSIPCECRKPAPGLIAQEAWRRGIALASSWLIGDILDDVEAGHRAGCRTVLVDRGSETEWVLGPGRVPDHVVPDFLSAAQVVAANSTPPDPSPTFVAEAWSAP
jgi:D-glycero-D-manno-heptose 1,7-bisphosphate phosphatase